MRERLFIPSVIALATALSATPAKAETLKYSFPKQNIDVIIDKWSNNKSEKREETCTVFMNNSNTKAIITGNLMEYRSLSLNLKIEDGFVTSLDGVRITREVHDSVKLIEAESKKMCHKADVIFDSTMISY